MLLTQSMLNQLDSSMDENHREMVVMTMEHVRSLALERGISQASTQPPQLCSRTMSHMLGGVSSSIRTGYGSVIHPTVNTTWAVPGALAIYDARQVATLLRDIGGLGTKVRVSFHNGREYLILTGYPGLRNKLKGTRYGIGHAQLVEMGIGKYGIRGSSITGFKISSWVGAGIELGEWLYGDERLWSDLFGGVGVELVKAGIASAIGYAGALAIGGFFTGAAVPVAAAAILVLVVGIGLNELDSHFGIKEAVKSGLRYAVANVESFHENFTQIKISNVENYIEKTITDATITIAEILYDDAKDWVIKKINPGNLSLPGWPSAPHLPHLKLPGIR